ncbi:hypothetical protein Phi10:1_gp055 [Cellulophaga phage phi10:1]|uniref:Uncharacterized protein n=1 Tax=Cellulophaga phage phi10:1 TaxID=1327981 RepID=R9ZZ56_9CAUD|nr:hypothetical protein Phi10:1_gp055 [Cellulophaga phage phi10:1]AGO48396.1 hypothetical protein Phi10:1_gp055 [Cellulophaga phage phi10:1]
MTTFTITIETEFNRTAYLYNNAQTETLEVKEFETIKEARKEIRRMIREEGYVNHSGNVYNQELRTELITNF